MFRIGGVGWLWRDLMCASWDVKKLWFKIGGGFLRDEALAFLASPKMEHEFLAQNP